MHGAGMHLRAGTLRTESHTDALVGLDAQRDDVGLDLLVGRAREQRLRRSFEMDRNFRQGAGQPFTGSQVKGHARPTPVLDAKLDRHVGFS